MVSLSQLTNKPVYAPKRGKQGAFERVGKVHMAVFAPNGKSVVGFTVKRPDIAGMVKRSDLFVAWDSLAPVDGGWRVTKADESFDDKARARLGIDWDRCIMWSGMDCKTSAGKVLGYVGDATFDEKNGRVIDFLVGDGGMAESLVGSVRIPVEMLVGYERGWMIVTPEAASQELTGGLAAKAGEGYARAKASGSQAAAKAGEAAGKAVDKGSRALGRQLGKTKNMFGSFMEEFKKASE